MPVTVATTAPSSTTVVPATVPAADSGGTGELPRTGSGWFLLAWLGFVLVAAGLIAVFMTVIREERRR